MRDDDRRLARLRELVDRLQRLPASAHRDWMLGEVRARLVDVDTGVQPEPLRPHRDDESERAAARSEQLRAATHPRAARAARAEAREPAPARPPARTADVPAADVAAGSSEALDVGEVLWLEDAPEDPSPELPRWRRGLRG